MFQGQEWALLRGPDVLEMVLCVGMFVWADNVALCRVDGGRVIPRVSIWMGCSGIQCASQRPWVGCRYR